MSRKQAKANSLRQLAQQAGAPSTEKNLTADSFANVVAKLGMNYGADNLMSYSSYPLGPFISRNRLGLESMYRSSWLVGQVVDTVAEDMTREGVSLYSEMKPDDIDKLQKAISNFAIWHEIASTIKWARLYGGCIAVILIDGADYTKPLNIEAIRKDQFKGLIVLDRWMINPSMGELITDICQDMGKPKYYEVMSGSSVFPAQKIHYTRVMRFDGIELPYYQRLFENMWGLSVVERMYDRMVAFDSSTTGAAQLLYKAYLRVIGVKGFREALAMGGQDEEAVIKQFRYIRELQGIEGITVLDGEDTFNTHTYSFSGISDMLQQFGQQISGATGIPLVRLFGQSPAGLSATGESDLRNYYDAINKEQENKIRPQMDKLLGVMAKSVLGKDLPEDFSYEFNSLWQLSDNEKSQIASSDVNTVAAAFGNGLIEKKTAMKELRQLSKISGRFTNITAEDIENAVEDIPPGMEGFGGMEGMEGLYDEGDDFVGEPEGPEYPNDMMGGQAPDMIDEEGKAAPTIKSGDSARKIRFSDKIRSIVKRWLDDGDFVESEHPRGQPNNPGQFVKKGQGKAVPKAEAKAKRPESAKANKSKMIPAVSGKELPKHIQDCKIPPAWTDVVYSTDPKAELLVKGKDAKGRVQYIYSESHRAKASSKKFARIQELNKKWDQILKENNAKKTEEALVLRLIMNTGIRPGSDEDTQAKVKAYGATTLEARHVVNEKGQIVLHFIGKKGVENKIPVTDQEVAKMLAERTKKLKPTEKLFKTNNIKLLDHTASLDGGKFKTKDFRTLLGTKSAMDVMKNIPVPKDEKEYKKSVMKVAKEVSSRLGNTPSVALASYINPVVFQEWRGAIG